MATLPDFPCKPQYDQPAGEQEKLPKRQTEQHQECRQTHINAPFCCRCATEQQKIGPGLWRESKKSNLLQKPHKVCLSPERGRVASEA
jgi:hypothetical protein